MLRPIVAGLSRVCNLSSAIFRCVENAHAIIQSKHSGLSHPGCLCRTLLFFTYMLTMSPPQQDLSFDPTNEVWNKYATDSSEGA
jgi:hypothetical protein